MKILNISLDKNVIDKNSAVAKRMVDYSDLVDRYAILVLAEENKEIDLSNKVKVISIKKSSNKFINFWKLKKKLQEIINKEKYNIITAQDTYFLGKLAVELAKKFHLGLEIQVHGFEKLNFIRKMIARYVLKNADVIRVVSQRLGRKLVDEFGVDEKKIVVIPIHSELRPPSLKLRRIKITNYELRTKKNTEKFIFLTVGRLVPVKNIEMQIAAVSQLKIKNYELQIIGDGEFSQKLKAQSQKLGLENNVKFLGWQNDLEKYYNQADCFLLTSNSEGWGMAVVEAASFGLPIIMTDVGLAGEIIKNNESGIVIPVGDQKALENAMIKIIEDENLREKLGNGARKAVENLPSKEEILELYKKSWEMAVRK